MSRKKQFGRGRSSGGALKHKGTPVLITKRARKRGTPTYNRTNQEKSKKEKKNLDERFTSWGRCSDGKARTRLQKELRWATERDSLKRGLEKTQGRNIGKGKKRSTNP